MKYEDKWFGCGDERSSIGVASGLVGGVLRPALWLSESVSDLVELLRAVVGGSGTGGLKGLVTELVRA